MQSMENQRPAKRRKPQLLSLFPLKDAAVDEMDDEDRISRLPEPKLLSLFPLKDAVDDDDDEDRISQLPVPKLLSLFPLKDAADEDRISQLPVPILHHHILSLLTQKDAVRTCVLSKTWGSIASTLPKLEFDEFSFPESSKERFISAVDNTLQRYVDQNLTIQEFSLRIRLPENSESNDSISLLDKWIPIVIMNMGVKTLKLTTTKDADDYSPLPLDVFEAVLQAESLVELQLSCFKLNNQINFIVKLQALKRLQLSLVTIEDETFEKIMSSSPLIERLVLESCHGLKAIKVNKARNLKHLSFNSHDDALVDSFEINDAPCLETIFILVDSFDSPDETVQRFVLHSNFFFPRLKSLILHFVPLPKDLLKKLSLNCPCIEELQLVFCPGLIREKTKLSFLSIKRLEICTEEHPFEAVVDIPSMLYFEFTGIHIPSISFAPTSREWESVIRVGNSPFHLRQIDDDWPLKLHGFLKALSQSRISSLKIQHLPLTNFVQEDTCDGDSSCDPVVVENLCLEALYSSSEIPALLNCLFRICRPRNIRLSLITIYIPYNITIRTREVLEVYGRQRKEKESQLAESIWKILEKKEETRQCDFWLQDLEKSSIHIWDESTNARHHVQAVCALSINQSIWFLCHWNKKRVSEVGNKR